MFVHFVATCFIFNTKEIAIVVFLILFYFALFDKKVLFGAWLVLFSVYSVWVIIILGSYVVFFFSLQIFKHLTSLEVEDFKDVKSGYSISFVSLSSFLCWLFYEWLLGLNRFCFAPTVWYVEWPWCYFYNSTELQPQSLFWGYEAYKDLYVPWWRNKNYSYPNKVERGNGMAFLSQA